MPPAPVWTDLPASGSSLSEETYRRLCVALDEGEWVAEQRLPSENVLAERYRVSRPILRQAIARLRAEGRVSSRKGSGHFVRPSAPLVRYEFGTLQSLPDVRLFLEFRCFLESEIAAQAAEHGSATDTDRVGARLVELNRALARGEEAIHEDIAFHEAIATASGNRFLAATLKGLEAQTTFTIRLIRELSDRPLRERSRETAGEHQAVAKAIAAGDRDAARAAMTRHLQGGIKRLFGR